MWMCNNSDIHFTIDSEALHRAAISSQVRVWCRKHLFRWGNDTQSPSQIGFCRERENKMWLTSGWKETAESINYCCVHKVDRHTARGFYKNIKRYKWGIDFTCQLYILFHTGWAERTDVSEHIHTGKQRSDIIHRLYSTCWIGLFSTMQVTAHNHMSQNQSLWCVRHFQSWNVLLGHGHDKSDCL